MTEHQGYHCYITGSYAVTEDIIIHVDLENVCICAPKKQTRMYNAIHVCGHTHAGSYMGLGSWTQLAEFMTTGAAPKF